MYPRFNRAKVTVAHSIGLADKSTRAKLVGNLIHVSSPRVEVMLTYARVLAYPSTQANLVGTHTRVLV